MNSILSVSLRNIKRIISALTTAPASTTQNIPALPSSIKKSEKSRFAAFARSIEVVSPTSVAAPLSTKAETMPAKSERATTTHLTFGIFEIRISDMSCGILDSIKR